MIAVATEPMTRLFQFSKRSHGKFSSNTRPVVSTVRLEYVPAPTPVAVIESVLPVLVIARAEGLDPSTVNELLRLTLLAPDIIEQLMAGRQPRRLTLMWFQRNPLPVDWQAQRDIIANFD